FILPESAFITHSIKTKIIIRLRRDLICKKRLHARPLLFLRRLRGNKTIWVRNILFFYHWVKIVPILSRQLCQKTNLVFGVRRLRELPGGRAPGAVRKVVEHGSSSEAA